MYDLACHRIFNDCEERLEGARREELVVADGDVGCCGGGSAGIKARWKREVVFEGGRRAGGGGAGSCSFFVWKDGWKEGRVC